jgi:hypothetical protein
MWRNLFQRYQSGAIAVQLVEIRQSGTRECSRGAGRTRLGYLPPSTRLYAPSVSPTLSPCLDYPRGTCLYSVWLHAFGACAEKRPRTASAVLDVSGKCTLASLGARPTTLEDFRCRVLEPLSQKCVAVSIAGTVLWSWDPPRISDPLPPFYVLVHDDHAFPIERPRSLAGKLGAVSVKRARGDGDGRPSMVECTDSLDAALSGDVVWMGPGGVGGLLARLVAERNVVPEVVTKRGRIDRLRLPGGLVASDPNRWDDRVVEFRDACQMRAFDEHMLAMKTLVMSDANRSCYSSDLVRAMAMPRHAAFFRLRPGGTAVCGVDVRRFYTSILCDLPFIPVFSRFDVCGSATPLLDHALYVVRPHMPSRFPIFFDCALCTCYGVNLRAFPATSYDIVACITPFDARAPEGLADAVAALYRDDRLSDEHRKAIPNILTGLLERRYRRTERAYPCQSSEWAALLCAHLNETERVRSWRAIRRGAMWLVVRRERTPLSSGFYPIKLLVYDTARRRMQELANEFRRPLGVRTDCLYLGAEDEARAHELVRSRGNDVIGGLRFVATGLDSFPRSGGRRGVSAWSASLPPPSPVLVASVPDVGGVLVTGPAGTGKSYSVARALVGVPGVVVVCPTRALVHEWRLKGFDAMTVNKFFGYRLREWERYRHPRRSCRVLVVDEIFQLRVRTLEFLARVRSTGRVRLIGMGDEEQLPPIDEAHSVAYRGRAIRSMFESEMVLTECVRMTVAADREWLTRFRGEDLRGMLAMFRARASRVSGPPSAAECVVCTYYQCTANRAADMMELRPEEGGEWVPRSGGDVRTIVSVVDGRVRLDDGRELRAVDFVRGWTSTRARTAYTLQGTTLDPPTRLVVCDLASSHVTRAWLVTVVTRVRELDQLVVWDMSAFGDVMREVSRSRSRMVAQDKKRMGAASVPSVGHLHGLLKDANFRCHYCAANIDTGFEFDRVVSFGEGGYPQGHVAGNLVVACRACNTQKNAL